MSYSAPTAATQKQQPQAEQAQVVTKAQPQAQTTKAQTQAQTQAQVPTQSAPLQRMESFPEAADSPSNSGAVAASAASTLKFSVGDVVEGNYDGEGEWYPGTIAAADEATQSCVERPTQTHRECKCDLPSPAAEADS